MSLNKISIYIETNTKIEYRKYTIYKATLYLKTILLKNVFLKWSLWMAGIVGDLFLKLYLVILVSGIIDTWLCITKFFLLIYCLKIVPCKVIWILKSGKYLFVKYVIQKIFACEIQNLLGFCTLCFCFPTKMLHLNALFFPLKFSVVPRKVI